MAEREKHQFGLIGTITHDIITYESGPTFRGLGGVLYQAAILCGLGEVVSLYTNLGQSLFLEVYSLIENWTTLRRHGILCVPGPGNKVRLYYPEKGERVEVLDSVVPALEPERVIPDLPQFDMLIMILNSGLDLELKDWQKIVGQAACPVWLDIHSLSLTKELYFQRKYRALPEWKEWAAGVRYLQANRREVACMLGQPAEEGDGSAFIMEEMPRFGRMAFDLGVGAVFVTLGREGVLVMTPEVSGRIAPPETGPVVDTTGCGDVFCAAAVTELVRGNDPMASARAGVEMASAAARFSGIKETYALASCWRIRGTRT